MKGDLTSQQPHGHMMKIRVFGNWLQHPGLMRLSQGASDNKIKGGKLDSLSNHMVGLMITAKIVIKSGITHLKTILLSDQSAGPNCGCKSRATCKELKLVSSLLHKRKPGGLLT